MLLITIDLLPGGHASHRRTLASMQIANITGLADISDYHIGAIEGANPLAGTHARSTSVRVFSHSRRQSVWKLVGAAIAAMEGVEFDEL